MADEGRLAAAVLADDRDALAGSMARSTPSRRARPRVDVDEAGDLDRSHSAALRRSHARRASAREADQRPRDGGSTPQPPSSRSSPKTLAADPSRTIRPSTTTATRPHRPSSTSVLCSATRSAVPVAARARSASPTSRVPSGSSWAVGSSKMMWRGFIARRLAIATSWPCPPESRAGSRSARSSIRRRSSADRVRASVAATDKPRFIGPSATSSKTVAATPDRCVAGFWKPSTTCPANSWTGRPVIACPSMTREPVRPPPIEAGASPHARRQMVDLPASFGPISPTISPSPSARSMSWTTAFAYPA